MAVKEFRDRPGIIEADIVEEAGRILMRKTCAKHGPFEDLLSTHPTFFRRMESLAFGRDFECSDDRQVHDHGASGIRRGRGTYLIVDLTNRCNMVCSPCYMDANATSFVHELDMEDVKAIFERAVSFKPQREINVLFSGAKQRSPQFSLMRSATRGAWVSTDSTSPRMGSALPRTATLRFARGRPGCTVCTSNSTEQQKKRTNIEVLEITWKSSIARLSTLPQPG
ncbi:MAG: hypothetical protein DMG30_03650 [Acidobacteria bacterium]|nr:MAG: hypothetical protein DMG30_03650 [Acidobacteriota bacterium]